MSIERIHKFPRYLRLLITILIISLFMGACSAASPESTDENPPPPTATIEKEMNPTPTPEATHNPYGDWMEYSNELIGFRYLFPAAWYGPEVNETEDSLRLVVGSDLVYPYGTDRTEQITTIPDSYYITIQYFKEYPGQDLG